MGHAGTIRWVVSSGWSFAEGKPLRQWEPGGRVWAVAQLLVFQPGEQELLGFGLQGLTAIVQNFP